MIRRSLRWIRRIAAKAIGRFAPRAEQAHAKSGSPATGEVRDRVRQELETCIDAGGRLRTGVACSLSETLAYENGRPRQLGRPAAVRPTDCRPRYLVDLVYSDAAAARLLLARVARAPEADAAGRQSG